jgi:hypothetical protein
MDVPDVRYARSGDLAIAYSVSGDGPIDIVLLAMMTNVGYAMGHPRVVGMAERLGSFARVILLDRAWYRALRPPRAAPRPRQRWTTFGR